jgi:polyhydroxyalkanoate synthesis regulator phasin
MRTVKTGGRVVGFSSRSGITGPEDSYDLAMPSEQWKHYLQAGMDVTEVTRKRAEQIVRDLVKNGEVQAHEAQQRVEELLERSRKTTEAFGERVRTEVQRQMESFGLVPPAKQPVKKPAQNTTKKTAKKAAPAAKKTTSTAKKAAGRP